MDASAGLPFTQDIKIPRLFPDISPFFNDQSNTQKLTYLRISMIIMIKFLDNHYVHACICFK